MRSSAGCNRGGLHIPWCSPLLAQQQGPSRPAAGPAASISYQGWYVALPYAPVLYVGASS